jgi:hypothetical protein
MICAAIAVAAIGNAYAEEREDHGTIANSGFHAPASPPQGTPDTSTAPPQGSTTTSSRGN